MSSKSRKRNAVQSLRALATEIGLDLPVHRDLSGDRRRKQDLTSDEFQELHSQVLAAASSQDHKNKAQQLLRDFTGEEEELNQEADGDAQMEEVASCPPVLIAAKTNEN